MALEKSDPLKTLGREEENQLGKFLKDLPQSTSKDDTKQIEENPEQIEEYMKRLGIETTKPEFDQQRADSLKNIAKYSSVGQALTNVVDAIYGAKGAKIVKREDKTTPAVLARYNKMLDDYHNEQYRSNMNELSAKLQALRMKKGDEQYAAKADLAADKVIKEDGRYDAKVDLAATAYEDKLAKEERLGDIAQQRADTYSGKTKEGEEKGYYQVERQDGSQEYLSKPQYDEIIEKSLESEGGMEEWLGLHHDYSSFDKKKLLDNIVNSNWENDKYPETKIQRADQETERIITKELKSKSPDMGKIYNRLNEFGIKGKNLTFQEITYYIGGLTVKDKPKGKVSPQQKNDTKRPDGTKKGNGWLGVRERPDKRVSTELSFGVEIDGKEILMPALVRGLTKEEIKYLLSVPEGDIFTADKKMWKIIQKKAINHAMKLINAGKSPFFEETKPKETRISGTLFN